MLAPIAIPPTTPAPAATEPGRMALPIALDSAERRRAPSVLSIIPAPVPPSSIFESNESAAFDSSSASALA